MVSPLPPLRSGIADYTHELLAPLAAHFEVVTYAPKDASRAIVGPHAAVLFQIGNDPLHAPSVEALAKKRAMPAVVVLHDFVLHHLFAAAYLDTGRTAEYVAALEKAHGGKGRALGERNVYGPRLPVWDLDPWAFPLSRGVLLDADAVLVHSRLVRGAVLRARPGLFCVEVPHHVVPAPETPKAEARERLRIPPDRFVVATLGVVTPAKRVSALVEALALLPAAERPFLFVGGAVSADDALRELVRSRGLESDIVFSGYLEEADFFRAASAADLAANLRHPTMGETSGAVCRLAGMGLSVLVSATGWFQELPDTFASKIPVGSGEVSRLAEELRRLAGSPRETATRGAAARAWGAERRPEHVAALYAKAVGAVLAGEARTRGLASRLAYELSLLGVGRAGAFGSGDRTADARIVASVAARSAMLLPSESESQGRRAEPKEHEPIGS